MNYNGVHLRPESTVSHHYSQRDRNNLGKKGWKNWDGVVNQASWGTFPGTPPNRPLQWPVCDFDIHAKGKVTLIDFSHEKPHRLSPFLPQKSTPKAQPRRLHKFIHSRVHAVIKGISPYHEFSWEFFYYFIHSSQSIFNHYWKIQ